MFTLRQIAICLLPSKSLDDIRKIISDCENAVDFGDAEWALVAKDDLLEKRTQMRLMRTIYEAQIPGETGIISSIMDSFEVWSKQLLIFVDWPEETRSFLTRFYGLCGAMYFPDLGILRQQFLLHSEFLPLMLMFETNFYDKVKICFAQYCYVSILYEQQEQFQKAIRMNRHQVLPTVQKTVADTVIDFEKFMPKTQEKVTEYVGSKKEFEKIQPIEREVLIRLLTIYNAIVSGRFLYGEKDPLCAHARAKEPVPTDPEQEYLRILMEAKDMNEWFRDSAEIVAWLSKKSEKFIKELLKIIKKKVDLSNQYQFPFVIEFVNHLGEKDQKWNDAVYFDENDGQFHWNATLLQ